MTDKPIKGDMRVWEVLQEHPETLSVFSRHGCPERLSGILSLPTRIMKIRRAARAHNISAAKLLKDLNSAVTEKRSGNRVRGRMPKGPRQPQRGKKSCFFLFDMLKSGLCWTVGM